MYYTMVSYNIFMNNSIYFQYNPWWEGEPPATNLYQRPMLQERIFSHIGSASKAILFLTGLRRVGKTSLMKIAIKRLLADGIPPKNIFYISMDDYTLKDLSILDVIQEYKKIHKLSHADQSYIFLDEITYKEDFRQQLKNIYDNTTNKVMVSASSSSALRDQKGWLTGRESVLEIHPLSFVEYLDFKQITVKQKDAALLESYFEDYMQIGGMPEYVLTNDRSYLVSLIDDIIQKDIVAHYGIKHPQVIKDYFALLMERAGKQISVNKISNILDISPDSANRYLQMFAETYLISLMPRYGKTNEQIIAPKKVYAADLGIRNVFTGFRDKGAIFENYVFSLIKHLEPRYLYQDTIEIDFLTKGRTLIEVKYKQTMEGKQKALFDSLAAEKKLVISGQSDLTQLDGIK